MNPRPKSIVLTCSAVIALPDLALACAVCMGAPGTPQAEGVNAALLTMLGVLSTVVGFGAYFAVRIFWLSRQGGPGE